MQIYSHRKSLALRYGYMYGETIEFDKENNFEAYI